MKVVAISDLHGDLIKNIPSCDVVCICGDICPLDIQNNTYKCVSWFCLDFLPWTNSLPCKKVIFIAGNHDFFLQDIHKKHRRFTYDESEGLVEEFTWQSPSGVMKNLLVGSHKGESKLIYLCDNSVEIEGKTFYGTPWVADLKNWAFYKDEEQLGITYGNIPKKVDVLMTHMPSVLNETGTVLQNGNYNTGARFGSIILGDIIEKRDIKYALCGHVHSGNHIPFECNGTNVVNVSIKDENYKVNYTPFEFEI